MRNVNQIHFLARLWAKPMVWACAFLISGCMPQPFAPPFQSSQPTPANTPSPESTLRPTPTVISPSPTPFAINCDLNGEYLGMSNPGNVSLDLVNLVEDCKSSIPPARSGAQAAFGSWLSDGSGFLYLDGFKQGREYSINVCIWDLEKQTTTRCLVEDGKNYLKAAWSPNADYVVYGRWVSNTEKEYVTVANMESNSVAYETDRSLLDTGVSQRFFTWHPGGKQLLVAEGNETIQTAVVINVETGARQELVEFDGERDFLVKGLWVQNGSAIVLGVIEPSLCCNPEFIPEARDLYWIRIDGTGLKQLLKDVKVGRFMEDTKRNRLLVDTYSNSGTSPMYWLDLQDDTLTRTFDDDFEQAYPLLMGITLDGRYVVVLDGQYRTWLFDVDSENLNQLDVSVLSPINWRP